MFGGAALQADLAVRLRSLSPVPAVPMRPQSPRTFPNPREYSTAAPASSRLFAGIRGYSRTYGISGRAVRVGFPVRFSGHLRSHLRSSYRAHTWLCALRGRTYAIPHIRMLLADGSVMAILGAGYSVWGGSVSRTPSGAQVTVGTSSTGYIAPDVLPVQRDRGETASCPLKAFR
jgi:hypothetical protein